MTPEEICYWLNKDRASDATGEWVPLNGNTERYGRSMDGELGSYGYSEDGVVGRLRWLTAEEANRIAVKHKAETKNQGRS